MRELSSEKLQEYIQNAIAIETDIVTQEKIATEYENNALKRKPLLKLNELPSKPEPPKYNSVSFTISNDFDVPYAGISFSLACGVVLLAFGLFLLPLADDLLGVKVVLMALCILGVCLMLPFFLKKMAVKQENLQREEAFEKSKEHYQQLSEKINQQNAMLTKQQEENLAIWEASNQVVEEKLNQAMVESQITREALYSMDVIYPKYRTLPALTSIYEYLITGRCDGLTGPHGAYNLYEDEIRKDMVISQLSVVIENLEQIKQNQYMLYQQVKEIQQNTSNIENELRQLKGYTVQIASLTALNTYYSALAERNTRVSMWCDIL